MKDPYEEHLELMVRTIETIGTIFSETITKIKTSHEELMKEAIEKINQK